MSNFLCNSGGSKYEIEDDAEKHTLTDSDPFMEFANLVKGIVQQVRGGRVCSI